MKKRVRAAFDVALEPYARGESKTREESPLLGSGCNGFLQVAKRRFRTSFQTASQKHAMSVIADPPPVTRNGPVRVYATGEAGLASSLIQGEPTAS